MSPSGTFGPMQNFQFFSGLKNNRKSPLNNVFHPQKKFTIPGQQFIPPGALEMDLMIEEAYKYFHGTNISGSFFCSHIVGRT